VKKLYLDTSAFFKVFVEEEFSEVVGRIIDLAREKKIQKYYQIGLLMNR
jgi:hypothetical protein